MDMRIVLLLKKDRFFIEGALFVLLCCSFLSGCTERVPFPESVANVTTILSRHHLRWVSVTEDKRQGILTLSGKVASAEQKLKAEFLARTAAPSYVVADNLTVDPAAKASEKTGESSRE
jgi:hypothetical protein